MRIVLWILQVLLAALYVWHGLLYVSPPVEMIDMINAMLAPGLRTFIGVAELLAAIGLIVPARTVVCFGAESITPLNVGMLCCASE